METKWTPGPWKFFEIAPEDKAWGACEVWPATGQDPVATMVCGIANARLAAAAPDLYAALEALTKSLETVSSAVDFGGIILATAELKAARAALAKARGEAP